MINEEKLKLFLYILLRDKLPAGEVEDIVLNQLGIPMSTSSYKGHDFKSGIYSNHYIEDYAEDIIERLK